MAKSFDDLVKRTASPRVQARAAARARQLLGELLLSELRALAGKTQTEVARRLRIKQPSLSKLEKQSDMQISTLRKIVAALGGELEVVARFPSGRVPIRPFSGRRTPSARSNPAKPRRQAVKSGPKY